MSDTGGRRAGPRRGITSAVTAAMPALTASLALEPAPVRVNLIAPGFVGTPLSASLPGDGSRSRAKGRRGLRGTYPITNAPITMGVAAIAAPYSSAVNRAAARCVGRAGARTTWPIQRGMSTRTSCMP